MVKLPSFFSDGMVICKKAKVWGRAEPGRTVTATFLEETYEATADESGRFAFTLSAEEYGGPFTLDIGGIVIKDVYVGRVWLCGGSANMEEPASRIKLVLDENIIEDTRIRVFQAERGFDFEKEATDVKGEWQTASGWFLEHINAVPYFFARAMLEKEDVPMGLICTPVGGTTIEGWLPEESLHGFTDYYKELQQTRIPGWLSNTQENADKRIKIWKSSLEAKDRGMSEGWHNSDYNDSDWESKMLFDTSGLPRHGSVWMRRKFIVPKMEENEDVILKFGRVENSVTVYINGVEVIHVSYMYPPCVCVLPDKLLKEGENTIAVRIVGEANSPAVVSGKEYSVVCSNWCVGLNGMWKRRTGAEMPMCPPSIYFFSYPCGAYNFMLAPLLGYSVDAILWGQGESNTARPHDYKALFVEFANNMRRHFGDVPIIYTQTPNYVDPYSYNFIEGFGTPGEYWAILREQQRQCLEIPNTAMAVTIDCGEYNDLNPSDKKTVGRRMALHARRMIYGEDIVTNGPIVEKAECHRKRLTIFFKHGEGLWEKGGHPLLDIIDSEGTMHRLYAAVWNDALNIIVGDMNPAKARFGWMDCPAVPLYNAHGLPASPFEIDITNI
ncbi:MAG: hypothetical protein FWB80_01125 [Defluviitaleaceae bacterium]|nr:hypothetical protein [Defluviitaleaceae bacterium]